MGILEGKYLVASGPVIIKDGKLLVDKDDFYKLPGGSVKESIEDLEIACHRKVKEEINGKINIIRPLRPHILWENPQTKEKMTIILVSYLSELTNEKDIKPIPPTKEIKWLDLKDIKKWKHQVSPYTQFLIEKGDIK